MEASMVEADAKRQSEHQVLVMDAGEEAVQLRARKEVCVRTCVRMRVWGGGGGGSREGEGGGGGRGGGWGGGGGGGGSRSHIDDCV